MTTAELHAAFPPGLSRPSRWHPEQYREWATLRDQSHAAESRAADLWALYWWGDRHNDPAAEAVLFQSIDLLLRLSGLLMLDAAMIAEGAGL